MSLIWAFVKEKIGIVNLIAGLAIIAIVILAIWHYNSLINEVNTLRSDKAKLEVAVQTQKETIDAAVKTIKEWKDAQTKLIATVEQMSKVSADANKDLKKLTTIYAKHNLTELSSKRPALVEDAVNRGTADALRLLSCASGNQDCGN